MKKISFTHFIFAMAIAFSLLPINSTAQNISLQANQLYDYLRNKQLADSSTPIESFCILPLPYKNHIDTLPYTTPLKKNNHISILPFFVNTQYNSHHPFGWNTGAMIPSAGAQLLVSGGIFAQYGKFSFQLQPEIVYAQNLSFGTFPTEFADVIWSSYYQWLNKIDNPEQYGNGSYKKLFPGQSAILYHPSPSIAMGISTENIWWGPGIFNALILSNNAPGFLHATIHSQKPIATKIGHFEFQLIGGKLSNSGILPPETNRYYNSNRLYQPKNDDWRYLSGLTVSWQPKWVKGLFIGFTKAAYLYHSDISSIADILPLANIIQSKSAKQQKIGSLGSVFMRYILSEENAEIYTEFGRNDKMATALNLLSENNFPLGYTVGLRKLTNLRDNGSRFEVTAEITQLELSAANLITNAESWYTNNYVRQGFTNNGKVLGAGIGPGSNSQTIDISWLKGNKKVGIQFQRIIHNEDFYYNAFFDTQDYTRHWVDLGTTAHAYWKFNSFYLKAEMGLIRSLNYEWWRIPGSNYFKMGYDFLNFHGGISLIYQLY